MHNLSSNEYLTNSMVDHFLTLHMPSEGYYMNRGSKFHAYAYPVRSEVEIADLLQHIRKLHPKARHFCTAFRLFPDGSFERSNDDGEPSGSAGKPILGQLIKNNLTNVFIVVVRYFGGTKLGIPGLIEAYKTSASNALDPANFITRNVMARVRIYLSYESFPLFLNYCKQHGIAISEESFSDSASLVASFPKADVDKHLISTLHSFSKMDFITLEDYCKHLNMTIDYLPGEIIL